MKTQTAVEWLEWLYKEGILNQKSFEIAKQKIGTYRSEIRNANEKLSNDKVPITRTKIIEMMNFDNKFLDSIFF